MKEFEIIINVKTKILKEKLRKELKQLFNKNTIIHATHITIRESKD